MKIINDNVAYVQLNDLGFLNQTDLPIPASIFMKVFGQGIIINDSNRYDFVEFNAPEEIEFFKSIDWMVDYNEVKDLSEQEFRVLFQKIIDEDNTIAQKFNAMPREEQDKNMDMVEKHEELQFKMYSLRDIFWFKEGRLKIKMPNGIDEPEVPDVPNNPKEEKGIRKLVKSMFNKKNKDN